MEQLKSWREVVEPIEEVLSGNISMSEFAADLSVVANGEASPQYQNPFYFYQRTYITEGTKSLLVSVARRISGIGGEPIIQLQTGFGGGKTHTMLAVYHMVQPAGFPTRDLPGLGEILDIAGLQDKNTLPNCRTVVIDGTALSPSEPRIEEGITLKTIWGRLAWSLGGFAAYDKIKASDENGTAPGKEVLIDLLNEFSPCVILVDELVAYFRQLPEDNSTVLPCGTFGANLSFIQSLTEAVKAVPTAIILASLPESVREAGSAQGEKALECLAHVFGRVQTLWKPVGVEESFEIVRRRLFAKPKEADKKVVCEAFHQLYRANADRFPSAASTGEYLTRLERSYPIHPELFDQLYAHWTTLERFQKTRGVLRMMANVIHALWVSGNRDLMIMPGSIPLSDTDTQACITDPLPNGWQAVIDCDIDGDASVATSIDKRRPDLGKIQATIRASRAIFLGTAPRTSGVHQGIEPEKLLLGVVEPTQSPATYSDAVTELSRCAHYFFLDEERHVWFGISPNLSQEMRSRMGKFSSDEYIESEIKELLKQDLRNACFQAVHVFTPHSDIPDDDLLRLVVLEPAYNYSKSHSIATDQAKRVLSKRGNLPRSHRNRLIFLACDAMSKGVLKTEVATYLAWRSIDEDAKAGRLNLDVYSLRETQSRIDGCKRTLKRSVPEAYKYVLAPCCTFEKPRFDDLEWEAERLQISGTTLADALNQRLTDQSMVIPAWAPFHLNALLSKVFFKDPEQHTILASRVWEMMACELYFPRLKDRQVLIQAIADGVKETEFFGIAQGKDSGTGQLQGVCIGKSVNVILDHDLLILDKETAIANLPDPTKAEPNHNSGDEAKPGLAFTPDKPKAGDDPKPQQTAKVTFFNFATDLNPDAPNNTISDICEAIEAIQDDLNIQIKMSLDISARAKNGFSEMQVRAIKENLRTLGIEVNFEEE